MMFDPSVHTRREFLRGRFVGDALEQAGARMAGAIAEAVRAPFVRVSRTAMACMFEVVLSAGRDERNAAADPDALPPRPRKEGEKGAPPPRPSPTRGEGVVTRGEGVVSRGEGGKSPIDAAVAALDEVDRVEALLSIYRPDTELARVNAQAAAGPVEVSEELFAFLEHCRRFYEETDGAFDPSATALVKAWGFFHRQGRYPADDELAAACERVGMQHVELDASRRAVRLLREGVEINPGAIGKGYALDCAAAVLRARGIDDALLQGGRSSVLALGGEPGEDGWLVGVGNPLFPERALGTLLVRDRGFSCSGCGVQYFRHEGTRYGHILDPRSGRPAEGMLNTVVLAPTAAEADALSTAFFAMGVEKARSYCDNHPGIAALLIAEPQGGAELEVVQAGEFEEGAWRPV